MHCTPVSEFCQSTRQVFHQLQENINSDQILLGYRRPIEWVTRIY